ncbi:hypothetical protein GCM10010470_40820 [Saccharopolyspora taberi]|uniref:Uncharacterized protein n=1 Tax=Saccharopolyspora taberi TaxID=60895 RepID=A0ABN3VG05_9PSEU
MSAGAAGGLPNPGAAHPGGRQHWSERRIVRWLEDSNVKLPKPSQRKLTTPNFSNFAPTIEISRPPRDITKNKLAEIFSSSPGRALSLTLIHRHLSNLPRESALYGTVNSYRATAALYEL